MNLVWLIWRRPILHVVVVGTFIVDNNNLYAGERSSDRWIESGVSLRQVDRPIRFFLMLQSPPYSRTNGPPSNQNASAPHNFDGNKPEWAGFVQRFKPTELPLALKPQWLSGFGIAFSILGGPPYQATDFRFRWDHILVHRMIRNSPRLIYKYLKIIIAMMQFSEDTMCLSSYGTRCVASCHRTRKYLVEPWDVLYGS